MQDGALDAPAHTPSPAHCAELRIQGQGFWDSPRDAPSPLPGASLSSCRAVPIRCHDTHFLMLPGLAGCPLLGGSADPSREWRPTSAPQTASWEHI